MLPSVLSGAAGVCLSAALVCGAPQERAQEKPISIEVRRPLHIRRVAQVAASGSVEPRETVNVAFQVAGKVMRVAVEEGQAVRQGQVLAELDRADYQHGLEAAVAQTAEARATDRKAQAGPRAEEVELARIRFEQAADEYQRMKQLYERKSLAPSDFKKVEAAWLAAREQYRMATEGTRAEDKALASAAVGQAEAAEAIARKRLADTVLAAPAAGILARRGVNPGETVAAGLPVFSILDIDTVRVRVGVPESDIAMVKLGQRVTVRVPTAAPQEALAGQVELIGPAAEPTSRTFPVRILVPNRNHVLRAGMIAEAQISTHTTVEASTLPGSAIVRDPQGATLVYVYFPAQKRVYGRRVTLGAVYEKEVEILSGLAGDEQVVTAGQNRVYEGALVDLARAAR